MNEQDPKKISLICPICKTEYTIQGANKQNGINYNAVYVCSKSDCLMLLTPLLHNNTEDGEE